MFVMRSTYDALQRECDAWATRYETLLEKYHTLRLQGATVRPEAQVATAPPIDDASRVMSAQRSMAIDSAAADFRARGMSADVALAEAERVIDPLFAHFAGDFQ